MHRRINSSESPKLLELAGNRPIAARGWRCRRPSGRRRRVVNGRLLPGSDGGGDNKGSQLAIFRSVSTQFEDERMSEQRQIIDRILAGEDCVLVYRMGDKVSLVVTTRDGGDAEVVLDSECRVRLIEALTVAGRE